MKNIKKRFVPIGKYRFLRNENVIVEVRIFGVLVSVVESSFSYIREKK